MRGHHVKVLAVFKGAAAPGHDPDDGFAVATTDVFLVEGSQVRYGSKAAWEAARR